MTDRAATGPAVVTVLVNADDDAAVTAALLDAHDLATGCVVVHPTPAMSSTSALAHDVLAALGRPVRRLSGERISSTAPAFKAATAWMIADGIREMIVLRAHLLSVSGWEHLIELARCANARLVLVCHGLDRRGELDRVLDEAEHHVTKDLAEVLPGKGSAPAVAAPAVAAPAVAAPAVAAPAVAAPAAAGRLRTCLTCPPVTCTGSAPTPTGGCRPTSSPGSTPCTTTASARPASGCRATRTGRPDTSSCHSAACARCSRRSCRRAR
jgi:hypothetical protein